MLVLLVPLLFVALWYLSQRKFPVPPVPSAVLISGAGTGFGRLTSFRLALLGYNVYSGVLSVEEGDLLVEGFELELRKSSETERRAAGKIVPIVLDITNQKNVTEAFAQLNKELSQTGLQALINNAGVPFGGPLEIQPFSDFRKVIEVNLLGHVLMTQTFLPLLRKAKAARIINISSLCGQVGFAKMSAYAASKFGLEGFSDSLRRELRHLNIAVSIIEPGFTKTPLFDILAKYRNNLFANVDRELLEVYAPLLASETSTSISELYNASPGPEQVVDAMVHAFVSPKPKTRYVVGSGLIVFLNWLLPNYAFDYMFDSVAKKKE